MCVWLLFFITEFLCATVLAVLVQTKLTLNTQRFFWCVPPPPGWLFFLFFLTGNLYLALDLKC